MDPSGRQRAGGVGGEPVTHADAAGGGGGLEVPGAVEPGPHQGNRTGDRADEGGREREHPATGRVVNDIGDNADHDHNGRQDQRQVEGNAAQQGPEEHRAFDTVERVLLEVGGPHRHGALLGGGLRAGGPFGREVLGPDGGRGIVDAAGVAAHCTRPDGATLYSGAGQVDLSGGQVEDAVAQGLKLAGGEESDDDPRVPAPGDLDGQLPQTEDAPEQGVDDVDRLDARQTGRAQLAAEDARAQVDAVGIHGVGAPPPAEQPEPHPQGDERDQAEQVVADSPAQGEAVLGDEAVGAHQLVEVLDRDEGQDTGDDLPALQHRRDEADPVPGDIFGQGQIPRGGGPALPRRLRPRLAGGLQPALPAGAHSPAILSSPRWDRTWRRRSASATGSPLIVASVLAEAVWSLTSAMPSQRASGPWEVSTNCMRP